MVQLRVEPIQYDNGYPMTYRAMATYEREEGKPQIHFYGDERETTEMAWKSLKQKCEMHSQAISEIKKSFKDLEYGN